MRRPDIELDGRGYTWLLVTATREARRAHRAGHVVHADPAPDAAAEIDELRDPFAHDHDPLERALDAELHATRRARFATLKPLERRDLLLKAAGYKHPEIADLSRGVRVNVAVLLGAHVGDMSLMEASQLRFVRSEASGGTPAVAALASMR